MSPTIMRIRGELVMTIDNATPVLGDSASVYLGIGLQDAILGVPGAAFEDPYSQSYGNDWMWWEHHFLYRTVADSDGVTATVRVPLDVRSKRRVDESDELVAVFVNSAPSVQPRAIGAILSGRVLVQETS